MLTDGIADAWDGVSSVADDVAKPSGSAATTILLAVLVFGIGALGGFIARLLWPRPR